MKYEVEVIKVGEMVSELTEYGMVIIFNENAPLELAEISVLHTIERLEDTVEVGDNIQIGIKKYIVTAIGEEANKTLKELGHCTFKFDGKDKSELPGIITLKGHGIPQINIGDKITIY